MKDEYTFLNRYMLELLSTLIMDKASKQTYF